MKKIILSIFMLVLAGIANAQFVVSLQLGGAHSTTATAQSNNYIGQSTLTGIDTTYSWNDDIINTETPFTLNGGLKFGYQFGSLQVGISGAFNWSRSHNDMSALEYHKQNSWYPFCPIFTPTQEIEDYEGWNEITQYSFTIAPYARYEVIKLGDVAFFLELDAFFKKSLKPSRHDFVDFYWMDMHNTVDSTFIIDDQVTALGATIIPGLSWQISPHCGFDLYFDIMALTFQQSTRVNVVTEDKWSTMTVPYNLSRREVSTYTTTETIIGFGAKGSTLLSPANSNWVRVGFNYTF